MGRAVLGAIAFVATASLLACGGADDVPAPSGQSMMPSTPKQTAKATSSGRAPVIESVLLSPAVLVPGLEVNAVVNASDPDGDPIRLRYTWTRNGREVQNSDKPLLYLVDLAKGDRVEVEVVASDGRNDSRPAHARGKVGNRTPQLSAVTLEPFGDVRAGKTITATPIASDPDNDPLRFDYEWKVNGKRRGTNRTFDTTGLKRGDQIQVHVVARDGSDKSRLTASPVLMLGNSPPMITELPTPRTRDGVFQYTFKAQDPDGDRNLRFFVENPPAGVHMDAITGLLTWSPTADQAGVHQIEVGVKDRAGEGSTFTFELNVRTQLPEGSPAAPSR
jgi:hypothetical protein